MIIASKVIDSWILIGSPENLDGMTEKPTTAALPDNTSIEIYAPHQHLYTTDKNLAGFDEH